MCVPRNFSQTYFLNKLPPMKLGRQSSINYVTILFPQRSTLGMTFDFEVKGALTTLE